MRRGFAVCWQLAGNNLIMARGQKGILQPMLTGMCVMTAVGLTLLKCAGQYLDYSWTRTQSENALNIWFAWQLKIHLFMKMILWRLRCEIVTHVLHTCGMHHMCRQLS